MVDSYLTIAANLPPGKRVTRGRDVHIELKAVMQAGLDRSTGLKLCWEVPSLHCVDPPFYANVANIRATTHTLRLLLDSIGQAGLNRSESDVRKLFRQNLPNLKRLGRQLFDHLFEYDDAKKTGDSMNRIEELLTTAPQGCPLSIMSDGSIMIPWGFLYSGDDAYNDDDDEEPTGEELKKEDLEGFWLHRFAISVRLTTKAALYDPKRAQASFRNLYALNKQIFDDVVGSDSFCAERKQRLDEILSEAQPYVVYNFNKWTNRWTEIANQDSLLYFYGHSSGNRIYLKEGVAEHNRKYCLDTAAIATLFKQKRDRRSTTICFFNGCNTAVGPRDDKDEADATFLSATHRPGFHGFIGTETEIPDYAAKLYAADFLTMLRKGEPIGTVFRELKFANDLLPWSLFYSCHANPDIYIDPSRNAMTP